MQDILLVRYDGPHGVSLRKEDLPDRIIWQPYTCDIGTRRGLLRAVQGLCCFNWITTGHIDQLIALSAKHPSKKV